MQDYHINIFYSEEDRGYIADIPDLKYCCAFGETTEQALQEVLIAKKTWLEVVKEKGKPIPLPKYKPIIYQIEDIALSKAIEEGEETELTARETIFAILEEQEQ